MSFTISSVLRQSVNQTNESMREFSASATERAESFVTTMERIKQSLERRMTACTQLKNSLQPLQNAPPIFKNQVWHVIHPLLLKHEAFFIKTFNILNALLNDLENVRITKGEAIAVHSIRKAVIAAQQYFKHLQNQSEQIFKPVTLHQQ